MIDFPAKFPVTEEKGEVVDLMQKMSFFGDDFHIFGVFVDGFEDDKTGG